MPPVITKIEQDTESRAQVPESWAAKFPQQFESHAESLGYVGLESPTAPTLPHSVDLAFLRDGRLRVVEPIHVLIGEEEEGLIVAEAEGLDEFGSGAHVADALIDLQHTLADLYFVLDEDKERLGPGLQQTWDRLQLVIERR